MSDHPFRCLFRVRFAEVDAQRIVFNSRYGEYTDLVAGELFCAMFSVSSARDTIDTRLVKQTTQWRRPARFDDVLEARAWPSHIGTSSFTIRTEFRREGEEQLLVEVETVYVAIDSEGIGSRPLSEHERACIHGGARGVVVDLSGPRRSALVER
ncbi:MAG: hotdog domain-containing protein [Polyangiales bacterium]